ncbi:TetR/AcrR family transcriptional regulator [Nocardioides jiangxiensis]|uniref:TetR-like C-terminal domain-containing protein n=1 Tax=Nocardioides jiangxiensis TaxID=3064524 RepID=A0ABT9B2S5_9ACTN|nr:TetR-like C-terminal domain-containing protein [Nocardioides sp. WY-20]MDO7867917.1 TetR-like C-terminal domain-containing protein [Nocardioides sp. WY-20]
MTAPLRTRRDELTRIALELLEAEGPEAVSTRRVAAAYGASTMAVYSEFGSLGGLVASVVDAGFGLLAAEMATVPSTGDPVADLVQLGERYRSFAHEHPHLYRVIYAVSPLAGHRRDGAELMQGAEAFEVMHAVVRRAYRDGRLSVGTPYAAALQLWISWHGLVVAELAGYVDAMPAPPEPLVASWMRALAVGLGDDAEAAARSIPFTA